MTPGGDEMAGRLASGTDDPGAVLLAAYEVALADVYGYLLARCGRPAVAEDLTAETFLAAARAVRGDNPPRISTAWLVGIARHKLIDHWRRLAREERSLQAVGDEAPAPQDPWDVRLDVLQARATLEHLAPHHRAALSLRYLDDLPVFEVAELLDRTVHATEALLVRARAAFRLAYNAEGQADA